MQKFVELGVYFNNYILHWKNFSKSEVRSNSEMVSYSEDNLGRGI